MKQVLLSLAALGLFAVGCAQDTTTPTPDNGAVTPQFAAGGIVHRVSVGSHDFSPPGVDANFSLIAIQYSDGSVKGQYIDRFAQGGGFHATVDCVFVDGNDAWISGVIQGGDFDGLPVITRVQDNGSSTNDPPDQISFSFIGVALSCLAAPDLPLFPLQGGEVKVDW